MSCSRQTRPARWPHLVAIATCLSAMVLVGGCASPKITKPELPVADRLPRPETIWVYNFAATAADVPTNSALVSQITDNATAQTLGEIEAGRKLGGAIATSLVAAINKLGLLAQVASATTQPRLNDLVIRGYLIATDPGSAVKRVAVGFGAGGSELTVAVEGFQVTKSGLRKFGSGDIKSGGNHTSRAALRRAGFLATANPISLVGDGGIKVSNEISDSSKLEGRGKKTAEEIGKVLTGRFQDQGWIP